MAEKAIDYLLRAGDQARVAYAHQEAIDYYRRALAFLRQGKQYERAARTLMKLGLVYHNAFDFSQARQAYQEGFALWQRVEVRTPAATLTPAAHAFRMAWYTQPIVDPALAPDVESVRLVRQLFSGLVELGPEMNVVPDVAQRWEVSAGGCKYLFYLRPDVRWRDVHPPTFPALSTVSVYQEVPSYQAYQSSPSALS